MTPNIASDFPQSDLALFREIKHVITELPDIDLGKNMKTGEQFILDCHVLSCAIEEVFSIKRITGLYLTTSHQHSWNVTPYGHILDAYPCEMLGGPLLVYMHKTRRWNEVYAKRTLDLRSVYTEKDFHRVIEQLVSEMNKLR